MRQSLGDTSLPLKWQWQLISSSPGLNAVDSEVRGSTTGVQSRCLSGTTGRHAQSEQAWGSIATAAASAQLTRRRGVLGQAWWGAAFLAQPAEAQAQPALSVGCKKGL